MADGSRVPSSSRSARRSGSSGIGPKAGVAGVLVGAVVGFGAGALTVLAWSAFQKWRRRSFLRDGFDFDLDDTSKLDDGDDGTAGEGGLEFVGEAIDDVKRVKKEVFDVGTQWLRFGRVFFQSAKDGWQTHGWEMVERTTRKGDIDGVDVVAVLRRSGRAPCIILILNYRPPVDAVCAEFPAGLVDAGESAAAAALRELREETGYSGECRAVSDIGFVDPYKSTENYRTAFVEVDGDAPENRNPRPERDAEENMQVVLVPVTRLGESLSALNRSKGCVIEAKLLSFSQGQAFERLVRR